jgi:uncharacterized DUF497 family protein
LEDAALYLGSAEAAANLRKHGINFAEAASAFNDPLSITIPDPDHSPDEAHFLLIGQSLRHTIL